MGVPLIVSGLLGFCCHYVPLIGWGGFMLKGSIVFIIYMLVMWNLALSKEEKDILMAPIFKVLRMKG